MAAPAPFNSPPTLLRRSLYEDPAFAGDPHLNPHAWERQGVAIPPDPSYDVPFAGGFPGPVAHSRPPPVPTHPQPPKPPKPPFPSSLASLSVYSSASRISVPTPPSATSSRYDGLSYLRDDILSPYLYDPSNGNVNRTSASSLPAYGESGDSHSTSSSSTLNTPGSHSDGTPVDSKPAPVVLAYEPPSRSSPPEQPSQTHKASTRPPLKDLDSIDELDESNPYGVGIHHNGPYEAIAAALGPASNPTNGANPGPGRQRGARDAAGAAHQSRRRKQTATSDPANPLVLNLKPGQILEHSIFQPSTGPPLPLARSPATYPPDGTSSPTYAYGYTSTRNSPAIRGTEPSVLRRNQSHGPPGTSHIPLNISQVPQNPQPAPPYGREPQRANTLATVPGRPLPLHRPSSLLDPPNVLDYPAKAGQPLPAQNSSYEIDPLARHERRPPPLNRDSFQQSQWSLDLVSAPKSAPAVANAHQSFPHRHDAPPPLPTTSRFPVQSRGPPQSVPPASSRSPPAPSIPSHARQRTLSGPSPSATARRYESPSETMRNLNLNDNSPPAPDMHRPPPSIMSSATQTGLAPRHIPRRLVMPTPLAPAPEPVPTHQPYQQPVYQQPYPQQPRPQPQPHPQQSPPQGRRPEQNVRFTSPPAQPPVHASTVQMHQEGARNLLRKRSAPAAPPSHRGGLFALLGFGRHDRAKPEMTEIRPVKQEMAEVRAGAYRPGFDPDALPGPARRANTMREDSKPKRLLSKQRR